MRQQTQSFMPKSWSRRKWLVGTLAWSGLTVANASFPGRSQSFERVVTPFQGDGPFYPSHPDVEQDNDLVRVTGMDALAQGTVLHLRGRILDRNGQPVSNARVEIWQCDSRGIYRHPSDRKEGRDSAFQGFGTCQADADGGYSFRTIRPVGYSGRAAHIHFKVKHQGATALSTQMYDAANTDRNARDFLYRRLTQPEREAVTVHFEKADTIEAQSFLGRFDMVLA